MIRWRIARVANDCAPPFVVWTWVLVLLAGCAQRVAIPGTQRDAAWEQCADAGCWFRNEGSGPVQQVCTETVLWPFGWNRRDCDCERVDPEGGKGAAVPTTCEEKR